MDDGHVEERIDRLSRQAARDRKQLEETIEEIPDPERAMSYLRSGAGAAIWLYIEARTGGRRHPFSRSEFERLERAMNDWFECYARCYGVTIEADFSIRTAAEALIETRNIRDVAEILMKIPTERGQTLETRD